MSIFFRGALTHLRIHISLVSRFGTLVETVTATQPSSALLSFAVARFGTACKTVAASPNISALLNFAPHPIVFPLRSLRGRCRLRQMRCKYIRAAGATFFSEAHSQCANTVVSAARCRNKGKTMLFQIKLGCTDRRGEHCSPVFFILCLPYGKLLNNTSSVTKGDTFPSSYAGEGKGRRKHRQ